MCAATSASLCWSLFVLAFASAEEKIITAESGQNVTLACGAPNNNNIVAVKWSRADLEPEYVLYYRGSQFDPDHQHPSFKERVELQDRRMKDGDVSLILKNVTAADEGTYECRVIQAQTNRRKRANLKTAPIIIIDLRVSPPAPGGGATEDEEEEEEGGSVGLIVGVSVAALLLVAAVGFVIYRKHQHSYRPAEQQPSA